MPDSTIWNDIPASYHNEGGGLSFADGHAEIKKWRDKNMINARIYNVPRDPAIFDMEWLQRRTTALK